MKLMDKLLALALMLLTTLAIGCSGSSDNSASTDSQTKNKDGLSSFEQEHGIGPVTETIELGSFDASMAEKGEKIFKSKCSACHKMGERYVGPDLSDVLDKRSPEYVMNMILNPAEMVKKHPEAKKMLGQFMTPMPYQNVSREETRAIVEYFRDVNQDN
jgi:cytochrome c551/c552